MSVTPRSAWKDPMIISTVVIAVATIANVVVSAFLWWTTHESVEVSRKNVEITRQIYQASNRPYIGINDVKMHKDAKAKTLNYEIEIKNFGTVAAGNINYDLKTYVNDQAQPQTYNPGSGTTSLPPTGTSSIDDTISGAEYKAIVENGSVLRIVLQVNYYGVSNDQHTFSHEYRYDVQNDRFLNFQGYSN